MTDDTRRIDLVLLVPVGVLLAIGVQMVYSSSFVVAHNDFGNETHFLLRHVLWVALGLLALVLVARSDYHQWMGSRTVLLYIASIVLLGLVLVPGLGSVNYGASRWLAVGPVTVQPSEIAKVAMVIFLARWITRVGTGISRLTLGTITFGLILCVPAALVLRGPDLGTTVVLVLTAATVFFLSGANTLHALLGACLGVVVLMQVVSGGGYRAERMEAFRDPWADPSGIGWHTTQALTALGSGGISGLGLGASRQKYYWVPNAHTDSIFAIVGEELGFIGTVLVLSMFLLIAWRGLMVAAAARDPLGRTLAAGATLLISWQALLNMAVVSHVVPNTGVPLPFVSYGGNAMVVSLIAVGLILSVARTIPQEEISLRSFVRRDAGRWRGTAAELLREPGGGQQPVQPPAHRALPAPRPRRLAARHPPRRVPITTGHRG